VGAALSPADFQAACLMCSEPTADQCHRRLVAEHLRDVWQDAGIKVEIRHL
jgi:uncharacterized protein (DUF488 family)